jgi:cobalt/nickel transport system permease protein
MTVVLALQAFIFADGGLSALGLNILNMGVLTVLAGWFIFKALLKILPKKNTSVIAASAVAAFISVPISAMGFVIQYAIGGSGIIELDKVLGAMLSVHVLIGIGEAVISAMTIGAVLATRSDLVYGASQLLPKKELTIKKVELN